MTHLMFARWFGIVSLLLSLGILFNLEDAREMAKHMMQAESGYIMGGVLPIVFGTLALMHADSFEIGWELVVTLVGAFMLIAGTYRVFFVQRWKALISRHIEQIPFLFSLFGLMLAMILLYIGFIAKTVEVVGN